MVLDVPPQKYFPIDNLAEWNNGNPLGLRTVHTYVLVYDMGNLDTFQVVYRFDWVWQNVEQAMLCCQLHTFRVMRGTMRLKVCNWICNRELFWET